MKVTKYYCECSLYRETDYSDYSDCYVISVSFQTRMHFHAWTESQTLFSLTGPRIWRIVEESVGLVLRHHPRRHFTGRFQH